VRFHLCRLACALWCVAALPDTTRAALLHGIDPNNLGKGDWIWQMSSCQAALGVANAQGVIDYEAARGMQWITVKGADGGNTNSWTQFNPTLIGQAHAAGLKIFAWAYCYGNLYSNLQGEINAALTLLDQGADGLIIDAESEYEGQPAAAAQYCAAIRARFPNTFLAYAPFPYITFHPSFPYIEFGTNCNAVMPQDYWADIGVSVGKMVSDMDSQWNTWQNGLNGVYTNAIKPIIPIGQAYNNVPGSDITNFVNLLKNDATPATRGGYHGVSFWSCQHHNSDEWAAIAAVTIGTRAPAIVAQPADIIAPLGASVTFSLMATGVGPLRYQWKFNGANINGATTNSYVLPGIQLTNAGGYSVNVTNSGGISTSATAFLSVIGPLTNSPGAALAPAGLVHWWPADGNAIDIFRGTNGTAANGFSYAAGKQGLGFHFDGASSFLTFNQASLPAPWTLCLWVNRQNAPGTSAAILSDGTYSLKLEQYNGTRAVGVTQLGVGDYSFGYIVPANTWVHVALVGSGSQTLLYTNGVLQGALPVNVPLPRGYMGATWVTSSSRFVDYALGTFDEVLVLNRALSAAEIAGVHSAGAAGLVRAPEFTGATMVNGQVRFALRGQTGKNFTIYTSPDAATWTPTATLGNPIGETQYLESPPAGSGTRFYRAWQR